MNSFSGSAGRTILFFFLALALFLSSAPAFAQTPDTWPESLTRTSSVTDSAGTTATATREVIVAESGLSLDTLKQFDQFQIRADKTHEEQVTDDYRRELIDDLATGDVNEAETRRYQLVFRATVVNEDDPGSAAENLLLQVEVKPKATPFDGTSLSPIDSDTIKTTSKPVASGETAETVLFTEPHPKGFFGEGHYKWRARTVLINPDPDPEADNEDPLILETSPWQEYSVGPDADEKSDFELNYTYKVAILMADSVDDATDFDDVDSPMPIPPEVATPCELRGNSYDGPRTKAYYDDIAFCLEDYFKKISMDALNVQIDVVTDGWLPVSYGVTASGEPITNRDGFVAEHGSGLEAEYEFITNAVDLHQNTFSAPEYDLNNYDIAVIVVAGDSKQVFLNGDSQEFFNGGIAYTEYASITTDAPMGKKLYKISVRENNAGVYGQQPFIPGSATFAHELMHQIGRFVTIRNASAPELYEMGLFDFKGALMASGFLIDNPNNPPQTNLYTKNFMGWLNESIVKFSDHGTYPITALADMDFGDDSFRYNITDDTLPTAPNYYLLETRKNDTGNWDDWLDHDGGQVNIYHVRSKLTDKYTAGSQCISTDFKNGSTQLRDQAGRNEYIDFARMLRFAWHSDGTDAGGKYVANVNIDEYTPGWFSFKNTDPMHGLVLSVDCGFIPLRDELKSGTQNSNFVRDFDPNAPPVKYYIEDTWLNDFIWRWIKDGYHPSYGLEYRYIQIKFATAAVLIIILYAFAFWLPIRNPNLQSTKRLIKSILFLLPTLLLLFTAWIFVEIKTGRDGRAYYINATSDCGGPAGCGGRKGGERVYSGIEEQYLSPKLEFYLDGMYLRDPGPLPDLDLHAVTPDGRHIGMNYATGAFENQIAGSIVSGDMFGMEEWIFVPQSEENVRYYVSAQDTKEFLLNNPERAAELTEAEVTEPYRLYAQTLTAEGFPQSATIEQSIRPEETIIHNSTIASDGSPVLNEPIVVPEGTALDFTPPTTTAALSGTEVPGRGYLPGVTVTLTAADNENGSGLRTTEYSLDNGTTWLTYTDPLTLTEPRSYTILYRSTDLLNNTEEPQQQSFTVIPEPTVGDDDEELRAGAGMSIDFLLRNLSQHRIFGSMRSVSEQGVIQTSLLRLSNLCIGFDFSQTKRPGCMPASARVPIHAQFSPPINNDWLSDKTPVFACRFYPQTSSAVV